MKKGLSLLLALLMVVSVFSPAFPSFGGVLANAATGDPVELAFNNLFVFEKWATNPNSTTEQVLHSDGTVTIDGATLTTDIVNGSFTLTKTNTSATEVYTAFSMSASDPNYNKTYYMMDIKPNTTYTFSYNLSGSFGAFTPYIFMYDNSGAYVTHTFAQTTTAGENSFRFTTGDNIAYAQVRFTINGTDATVNNINLYKTEVITYANIFDFDAWAANEKSREPHSYYCDGTVTANTENDSITFNTNTNGDVGAVYTGFSVDSENAASNEGYYTIAVEPNTTYTFSYTIPTEGCNLGNFVPYIAEFNSSNLYTGALHGVGATNYEYSSFMFTTGANASHIQLSFSVTHQNQTWQGTITDIGLYKTETINHNFDPHRICYTEGAGTYGTLPTPTDIPEGKVFAGWYTGENGTGKLITSETEISYESYTVYPKYETAVDAGSLIVVTQPTKTTYTVGEKFDPAGLVLQATVTTTEDVWNDADGDGVIDDGETTPETRVNTYNITSGYTYSPLAVGTTAGTQNITISYGGQTVTVPITVVDSIDKTVTVNGAQTTVGVANNEYTINLTSDFNRYEFTYYSNAYVKGTLNTVATDGTTVSEEFFLEPSDNGTFASYIDAFLDGIKYTNISTIKFEVLDKEFGTFELYSVETILAGVPTDNMQYQQDNTHKVGIDLSKGGSLTYLEELSGEVVAVANGEGVAAEVDYKSQITTSGTQYGNVNLINRHDPGRYVQQSYYGTREDPYVVGDYNGVTWNYNPVQGGNYQFESSKIIDYRITTNQIYVKTRPLDWGKYSDEYANSEEGDWVDNDNDGVYDEGELMLEPRYGDDYITDSYMEAWYVFEDDTVKTYCRFVDYSGYPSATTTQELPAFYCVEPLNTFAYYNADTVWEAEESYDYANEAVKINDPDFWGVSAAYNNMLTANGMSAVNPSVTSKENWAAFMGSDNEESFGIGIYSAGVTNFHYGTYPQIYKEPENGSTTLTTQFDHADMYEDGTLTMPDMQDATSYIAPVNTMTFQSYNPYTYSYYIATGNLHDIREDFRRAVEKDNEELVAQTTIAVPETAYMEAADGASKIGKYYVNNIINETSNTIETVAESTDEMSFSVHIDGATKFTVDITNVTNPADDIDLYTVSDKTEVANTDELDLAQNTNTGVFDGLYYLAFNTTGLSFGEKATAKWVITGYDEDDNIVGTYTAYTVLYASERTVGAVAESRKEDISQNEISSWITGANGVDHSQRSPLGSFHGDYSASGYFKEDPLVYSAPLTNITSTGETADDLINVADEYSENAYVLQTATNGHDHSRAQSYLGLLKVDKSRYTNTDQIPNLRIGYDVLRVATASRSLASYYTFYTLGTAEAFTSTELNARPSGWTEPGTGVTSDSTIPVRESVIPSFDVSTIDGQYIHALNQARCWYTADMGESTGDTLQLNSYATAGTSLLCSVTDKGTLRDTVTQGYGIAEESYSEDSYAKFEEALEKAGTVLGDPSTSQEEIDNAQKDLSDAMDTLVNNYYSLKYDNIFSAYEFSQYPSSMSVVSNRGTVSYANGALTVVNDTITDGEAYTNYGGGDDYYHVDLEPNTEYVFEYDVTTDLKAQAFMFFYNSSGGNAEAPTNMSIKTNNGAWGSKTESNPWFGNYTGSAGTYHYVIKFTTGATTDKAGFRFGNTSNDPVTSTFSNIRVVDAEHYYEDATYSATEAVYKEYASYGTMVTPTRPGYVFAGWKDAAGNDVTGASIATQHLSVYSQWDEAQYTINYNANGGEGEAAAAIVKLTEQFTLPTNFAMDNHVFAGWAYEADGKAVFKPGQTITIADIQADKINSANEVTLYAIWEKCYSVYFSQNGGTGEIAPSNKAYSEDHILPDSTGITYYGYEFLGWALNADATTPDYYPGDEFNVSEIDQSYVDNTKQEVILHAVWSKIGPQNVTFDNLVDISAWPKTSGNGTVDNITDTGFTVIADGNGEATCSSAYFPVEEGHKYVVEADIKGEGWDIYFFFCDANGNWVDFSDSGNRLAADHNQTTDGIHVTSTEFTAPAGAVKAQLRVDANNGGGNAVRFENIRVNDTENRTYLETVNKYVDFGEAYGELPVPVKPGQVFLGWQDADGNTVTADTLMESASTVYLTSTWTTDANSISNDTVVVEYGSPVKINVLANDKSATAVNAIGVASIDDSYLGHTGYTSSKFTGSELDLTNGKAVLNADGTITYTLDTTNVAAEEVFYYEAQIDGKYYYAKVTVIPATTVYYEDSFFTFNDSTVTKKGVEYNYNWSEVGTSVGEVFQDTDRPGPFNFEDDANNVYGYDSAVDGEAAYSGGSAHYVEVDAIAGTGAPTATFTFTGTGFDLFTATDSKSGVVTVAIYEGDKVDSTKRLKGIISNVYFGYSYDDATSEYVPTDSGALFQVPFIRERGLDYGTYTVVVQPRYNKSYDFFGAGKSGVYVDSVRIFDPMGTGNDVANAAYKADGEYAPQYLEIRDTLVMPIKDENGTFTGSYDITTLGDNTAVFLDGGRSTLADFAVLGPKNEVYLSNGNSVAFDIVTNSPVLPSTIQLGMGLTGKGGTSSTVTLMNAAYSGWSEEIVLNSTAERYYNIESVVDWVLQDDGTYKTASPIIITNNSDAIIALTSLKWAFNQDIATTMLSLVTDEQTPVLAKAAINRMLNPEPDNTVIAKENIAYAFSSDSYALGESGTLTITTEHGVAGVTVDGAEVVNCEAVENDKLNWTFEFTADVAGDKVYEIVARDENGNTSEAIYATTYFESDSETGAPEDDVVEDDDSDDITGDISSGNLTPDSFVKNLLNGIFGILGKLFGLFVGGATV